MNTWKPDPKPVAKNRKKHKSYIRKVSPKKARERRELHNQDHIFYTDVWKYRTHVCTMCKTPLGDEMRWNFMHHLLKKGERAYKHLRHEKMNVILVCQECHDAFHYATPPVEYQRRVSLAIQYFEYRNLL